MVDLFGKTPDGIPEDIKGESETLAAHKRFDSAEEATKLYSTNSDFFHNCVPQLLYLLKIPHP